MSNSVRSRAGAPMVGNRSGSWLGGRLRHRTPGAPLVSVLVVAVVVLAAGIGWTLATFTAQHQVDNQVGAAQIFRDQRSTVAFAVSDRSAGTATDQSSPLAFSGDGRWFTSRPWSTAWDGSRFLEVDLGGPLPAGLDVTAAELKVRLASDAPGTTTCFYADLRRASSGSLLSSHGSSVSPLGCVTGTAFAEVDVALGAVSSTDVGNDVRVRIHATSSAIGTMRIDRLVVSGSSPHAPFTLFPLVTRAAAADSVQTIPWGLAGP